MCVCVCVFVGWRPRRTIVFASWDAEEFGLLGSTEWAEVAHTHIYSVILDMHSDHTSPGHRTTPSCCRTELWPTSTQTLL